MLFLLTSDMGILNQSSFACNQAVAAQ